MPHSAENYKVLSKEPIVKRTLRDICGQLMARIPNLPIACDDQMKDPIFCAGMLAGFLTILSSDYIPEQIEKRSFNVVMLHLIDQMFQLHGDAMGISGQVIRTTDNDNVPKH